MLGLVEWKGELNANVVDDLKAKTVMPIIQKQVIENSQVMTDEFLSYAKIKYCGFNHDVVKHGIKEYVRGDIHTNTIEGFWSQFNRSVSGTYHIISPKHLQLYVDEFAWRYNHRKFETPFFELLLQRVVL